jgi:hypothetical protein
MARVSLPTPFIQESGEKLSGPFAPAPAGLPALSALGDFTKRRLRGANHECPVAGTGVSMGFLIVWVVVVASAGVLLAGWMLGPQNALHLPSALDPELAAVGLLAAVVLLDAANSMRRRRKR